MGLSKSKYTTYCQCPKALWLKTYDPDKAAPIDEGAQARFEAGNEVGDLAMGLFGNFVEVTSYKEDGNLDLKAMIDKTNECLADGIENIAEASFAWEGNYCAVDILHKTPTGYAIYEVKSSTGSDDPEKKKCTRNVLLKYAYDIAYQKYVLEKCDINVTGVYLVRLNSDYVRGDELDLQQLFHITDMSELVAEELLVVENKVAAAQYMLKQSTPPCIEIGKQCKKPYLCGFFEYCRGELPENSVFELYRLPFTKKLDLFKEGKLQISDLDREDARNMIQHIQLDTYLIGEEIDKDGIRDFLDTQIRYPLYFLDFETSQYPVPAFKDSKPYQQIPFQYSLHYIEEPGGELKHTEFLGDGVNDPRRALAEQLVHDIPLGACTTAYNKGFECGRIRELAEIFPDLREHLLDIRDHIVDFLDPFRQGYFYKESMHGSFSIKKVLPALFPDDPELDYHNLTGGVQNGGDAMTIYPKMGKMTLEEREKTRQALLDYCGLDTYAMVKVWEKLVEVSRK